jgi:2-C-methyl-D-erythritol 4-phosphate cytidylyltransferase
VVVAGGAGRRVGGDVPKQFVEIRGRAVLQRALETFLEHPAVESVVVVLPAETVVAPPRWLASSGAVLVAGGAERSDSVRNGLQALPPGIETVLVHDGARPFVSRALVDRILAAARDGPVIPAIPVSDTVKEVDVDGRILSTPDRARLRQAQTPQAFPLALLLEAHRRAPAGATDDAALVERLGARVRIVEGDVENIKITRPVDLLLADALAARRDAG